MFHERLLKQLSRSLWVYRWRKLEISKVWTDGGDVHILLQNPITPHVDAAIDDTPSPLCDAITASEAEEQLFAKPQKLRFA